MTKKKYYKKLLLAIVLVLVGLTLIVPTLRIGVFDSLSTIYTSILVNLVNTDRLLAKANELSVNPLLEQAAQMKANDMATKGYFAHNTPDGKTPWYWIDLAGYKYSFAGENLAVNFLDSEDIHKAWMNSPLHKANILNRNYTEIGIATSTGIYKGREAIFVVQMFGRPQK